MTTTYYLSNADITAATLETLATAAPASLDEAQGWTVAQKGVGNFCAYRPDTTITRTSNDWVTSEPTAFTARGYRTAGALNGYFEAGNWVLAYKVKSNTYYAQKGYVKYRLWRSVNANGSSATQITDGWKASTLIAFTAANQYQTGTITWADGATAILSNEYLFLEIEWAANTSGGNNGAIVYWAHNEGAAEKLDAPNFITMFASMGATLNPITASITGAEVVSCSAAKTIDVITASIAAENVITEVTAELTGTLAPITATIVSGGRITAAMGPYFKDATYFADGYFLESAGTLTASITASGTANVLGEGVSAGIVGSLAAITGAATSYVQVMAQIAKELAALTADIDSEIPLVSASCAHTLIALTAEMVGAEIVSGDLTFALSSIGLNGFLEAQDPNEPPTLPDIGVPGFGWDSFFGYNYHA